MSKFNQYDHVRVTDPESERFDQVFKIAGTWRGSREWVYNFNVDGILFSFAEHHLILAEPTATETINEMLAESEPKKSVGMDEREIDGEYVPAKVTPAPVRSKVLRTAERLVNGRRQKDYGDPAENYGRLAALLNAQFSAKLKEPLTAGDAVLAMVHLQLSRLANTPDHMDSFVDACGYLALGAEIADGL